MLSALKTVLTLLLFRVMLKRIPTFLQYVAVVLLAAGAAVSRLGSVVCAASDDAAAAAETWGVLLTLISCAASSFAGVYNELLLKKDGALHDLSLQNAVLYGWGVLINAAVLLARDGERLRQTGFFAGYDGRTVLLVIVNAVTGLSISAVLKFGDNLLRVFAHTCAMLLSMALECVFLFLAPSPELVLATVVVGGASAVYATAPPPQASAKAPQLLEATAAPEAV